MQSMRFICSIALGNLTNDIILPITPPCAGFYTDLSINYGVITPTGGVVFYFGLDLDPTVDLMDAVADEAIETMIDLRRNAIYLDSRNYEVTPAGLPAAPMIFQHFGKKKIYVKHDSIPQLIIKAADASFSNDVVILTGQFVPFQGALFRRLMKSSVITVEEGVQYFGSEPNFVAPVQLKNVVMDVTVELSAADVANNVSGIVYFRKFEAKQILALTSATEVLDSVADGDILVETIGNDERHSGIIGTHHYSANDAVISKSRVFVGTLDLREMIAYAIDFNVASAGIVISLDIKGVIANRGYSKRGFWVDASSYAIGTEMGVT